MRKNYEIFEISYGYGTFVDEASMIPTKLVDAVREYAIRKLAQQIHDNVECSRNPRDKIDWETAVNFINDRRKIVLMLSEMDLILRASSELRVSLQCQPCDKKDNFLEEFKGHGGPEWQKIARELDFGKWICDAWIKSQCLKEQAAKIISTMNTDKKEEFLHWLSGQEVSFETRDSYLGRPIWDAFYQNIKTHLPREHYTRIKYS